MKKCPKCQAPIDTDKISFKDECFSCKTDLHVCIYCTFFDEGKSNQCREPQADYVKERDRANYCEYFIFKEAGSAKPSGKEEAEKLFSQLFKKS
ncbi:MAG: hypothetical protein C0392_10490 [Syntrophus sp. (in: bacteria)]|nr:hypothetical protein [Syntrophus sp. (in: bacteria)]